MSTYKTSITAYSITCCLAKLAADTRWMNLIPVEARRFNNIFAESAADTPLKRLVKWLPPKLHFALLDSLFIPGMTMHYLFRKLYIGKVLESAVASGVTQVVVLGGGFDTQALCASARHKQVQFFEFDLPATQAQKLDALAKADYRLPDNIAFISADLSRESIKALLLSQAKFEANKPTLVLIEGVLMYLSESEVQALFLTLGETFQGKLTVVFGAMVMADEALGLKVRLFNALFLKSAEPTKWACSSKKMPELMRQWGFKITESISYKDLQRQHLEEKEIFKVPEEDENYYLVEKL